MRVLLSVGEQGQSMGGGLLDVLREPLWRETGQRNMAIYTTGSSKNPGKIRMCVRVRLCVPA